MTNQTNQAKQTWKRGNVLGFQSLASSIFTTYLLASNKVRCMPLAKSVKVLMKSAGVAALLCREMHRASQPKHWSTSSWLCFDLMQFNEMLLRFPQLTCTAHRRRTMLCLVCLLVLSTCKHSWTCVGHFLFFCQHGRPCARRFSMDVLPWLIESSGFCERKICSLLNSLGLVHQFRFRFYLFTPRYVLCDKQRS